MKAERLKILSQPTDWACGPTCLQAVYRYYDHDIKIETIMEDIAGLKRGGTLAVTLGTHALKRGFNAKIYTFNLNVFDPTWFKPTQLASADLQAKLKTQSELKTSQKLRFACMHYMEFLSLGGKLAMEHLCHQLITKYLKQGIPILTGLSSTYLYMAPREYVIEDTTTQVADDVKGYPEGHFVLIYGYDHATQLVTIMDPYAKNPYSQDLKYTITLDHLQTSIMLGVLTYDANMMIITSKDGPNPDED